MNDTTLRERLEARADQLDTQAAELQRRAELELTALKTAAAELRALLAPPPAAPDAEA